MIELADGELALAMVRRDGPFVIDVDRAMRWAASRYHELSFLWQRGSIPLQNMRWKDGCQTQNPRIYLYDSASVGCVLMYRSN